MAHFPRKFKSLNNMIAVNSKDIRLVEITLYMKNWWKHWSILTKFGHFLAISDQFFSCETLFSSLARLVSQIWVSSPARPCETLPHYLLRKHFVKLKFSLVSHRINWFHEISFVRQWFFYFFHTVNHLISWKLFAGGISTKYKPNLIEESRNSRLSKAQCVIDCHTFNAKFREINSTIKEYPYLLLSQIFELK